MKGERDEGLKAAGLILQLAQPNQVIDAMPGLLDVTVEHGGVGAQAELMSLAMDANPGVGIGFVLADLVADFGMENFGAAARQAAQPGFLELGQDVARRSARQPREPIPLD